MTAPGFLPRGPSKAEALAAYRRAEMVSVNAPREDRIRIVAAALDYPAAALRAALVEEGARHE